MDYRTLLTPGAVSVIDLSDSGISELNTDPEVVGALRKTVGKLTKDCGIGYRLSLPDKRLCPLIRQRQSCG
jgi:hypothetical protein